MIKILELSFQGLSILASIFSIWTFVSEYKKDNTKRYMYIAFTILSLIVIILSVTYFKTTDAKTRAGEYYDRYSSISFESDLSGSKIKSAVTDGIVIMKDLGFDKEYPEIYTSIIKHYNDANNEKEFKRDKYVSICREIFGALGSYSKKLYK